MRYKVDNPYSDYKGHRLYTHTYSDQHDTETKYEVLYDKKREFIDFSIYQELTEELFHMWVDLDRPSRMEIKSNGPLYPEDIILAWMERFKT